MKKTWLNPKPGKPRCHSDKLTFSSRILGDFHLSRNAVFGISLCLFFFTAMCCIFGKWGLDHAEQTKSWPSVRGLVTDVRKHKHYNDDLRTTYYTYTSTINYDVDGKTHIKIIGKRLNQSVDVFYDPFNPVDSVLEPGVESDQTDIAFFAAIFLGLLATAVLVIGISPKTD